MTKRLLVALATLMLAAFALSACGDDDDDGDTAATSETAATTETSGAAGAGGTIAISADPSGALAFEQTEVDAEAGTNTIEFTNDSSTPHDVVVEDDSGEVGRTDVIQGDTDTAEVDLEPGSYTFYCSVPGHREAGMEGTINVK